MSEILTKFIAFAKGEEGYMEKKSNKSLDSKTANKGFNNYTKYNRDMKKIRKAGTLTDYWCCNFVCWLFAMFFGTELGSKLLGGFTNYVPYLYNHFKKAGRIYKTPKVGDVVIFKNCSHVGLVIKATSGYIWTIEGNTSKEGFNNNGGMVAIKKYSKKSSYIKCYGRPDYTLVPVPKKKIKKPTKTTKKVDVSKYPVLKKGSKGKYVKKLQKKLKITADGSFGVNTEKAVKKFQKKKGLKVDGEVGPKTWKALFS